MIRFIKRNLIFIFLIISSLSMGILALATALRIRESRSPTPQSTQALSESCSLTFTIDDTTPRNLANLPLTITPNPTSVATAPTNIPLVSQEPTQRPTTTPTRTPTPTKTPTPVRMAGGGLPTTIPTKTPTPKISTLPQTGGAITATPTIITPHLPESGIITPTFGALLFGIILLSLGLFYRRTFVK